MGGRTKSRRIPKKPVKIRQKTIFDCAVCGYKDCIMIKINKGFKKAKLECDRCVTRFQLQVKRLDEPIDVYHEWLRKLKSKSIVPFPGRLDEDSIDLESVGHDVEQLLQENKQNKRKRIKKNIEEEEEEDKQDQDFEESDHQASAISDDSLIQKQKVEDIEENISPEQEDPDDESYNVKAPNQQKKNKKKK